MTSVARALVARDEPAEAVDPGKAAFDQSSMSAQLLTGLDAASGDAGFDAPVLTRLPASARVVGLVGMQLVGSTSLPAASAGDWWDGVEQVFEELAVVNVGAG